MANSCFQEQKCPAGGQLPESGRRLSRAAWTILIVYTGSLFLVQLGSARTFTGHESFVAQAAREMVATGDWLVPRIGGKAWLEKPPLPHWTVASLGWLLGGIDEFVARLPSAVAGLLGVLLIASLAARWFGPLHGLLTGLVQATTVYTVSYARLAEADIYLWLLVVACLWVFAQNFIAPTAATPWYAGRPAFFVLLGLTQLTKGPLFGAVIALLPCVGFVIWQRRWDAWKWFFYWPGLLICVILAVAWPFAILLRYPEAAELWWLHTFARVGGEGVLNPKPAWYYFKTLPWQVLPWTLIMLPALPSSLRRAFRERSPADRLLWLWLALPFLVLSAVSAKHHHYLIYALPPCSFWAADGLLRLRTAAHRLLVPRWRFGVLFVLSAGILTAMVWGFRQALPRYYLDVLIIAAMALAGGTCLAWFVARQRYRPSALALFATLWLIVGYAHHAILCKTDHFAEDTALFRRIEASRDGSRPILVYGIEPSRILLYLGPPIEVVRSADDLYARWLEMPDAPVLTSVGHGAKLEKMSKLIRLDQTPQPRWANQGSLAQLAIYRLDRGDGQDVGPPGRQVSQLP